MKRRVLLFCVVPGTVDPAKGVVVVVDLTEMMECTARPESFEDDFAVCVRARIQLMIVGLTDLISSVQTTTTRQHPFISIPIL